MTVISPGRFPDIPAAPRRRGTAGVTANARAAAISKNHGVHFLFHLFSFSLNQKAHKILIIIYRAGADFLEEPPSGKKQLSISIYKARMFFSPEPDPKF
jgi:hypothetical protein